MSSFFYFCISTALEFLGGCGFWKLSHDDFKAAKKDPNASSDVIRRARIERFFAFFFFAASAMTAIGLYVYKGEQQSSDAAFTNATNGWAQATNDLDAVKTAQQPRIITAQQVTNFVYLTAFIKKIPISVHVAPNGDDAESFAAQLRYMLDQAGFGFGTNSDEMGIIEDRIVHMGRPVGVKEKWPSVFILSYTTNKTLSGVRLLRTGTNGIARPEMITDDKDRIYEEVLFCLQADGIVTTWKGVTYWLSPGEWRVYVPPKNL